MMNITALKMGPKSSISPMAEVPLPILGDASHKAMVDFMLQLPSQLRKPDAILVISAHWKKAQQRC